MAMIVANNLNAISTQRNLNLNNRAMSGSLEKLSSGYKINTGKDDPSGLVISEQLRAQTIGLKRAVQNTQEANNVLGIAEGALNEMNNILKKMRQLAIHSANNGVTSPEQIAADQAEVDSSIQTLDRIARTTKFSDQFLINGSKELTFESSTTVTDSYDMKLINESLSDMRQIFKRDGYNFNINFSGGDPVNGENGKEAQKGYFEVTKNQSAATQVAYDSTGSTANYTLTQDQAFTISGNQGSRYLSFAKETHIGEVVSAVNNVVDSTGVKATLIYDAQVTKEDATSGSIAAAAVRAIGTQDVYCRDDQGDIITNSATTGVISASALAGVDVGLNTDGDGRVYLKMTTDTSYTLYKDEAMTMQVATGNIATAPASTPITAVNNSGLSGFAMNDAQCFLTAGDSAVIQVDNIMENSTGTFSATQGVNFSDIASDVGTSGFSATGSCISGIRLGENTSETGKVYVKINTTGTTVAPNNQVQLFLYKDERMRAEDLVAQSEPKVLTTGAGAATFEAVQFQGVIASNGQTSGLFGTFNFSTDAGNSTLGSPGSVTTEISTENLAMRMSAKEYGGDQFVKVEQHEGALFTRYSPIDGAELLDAGLAGAKWTSYGRDATVSLNGQVLALEGIKGEVTNLDASASLVFNEGGLGTTTIAAVGYDEGAYETRAGQINNSTNDAIHALHSTSEVLGDWKGGMQFQLGEGSGDQERTVFSVKSMTATDMGRVDFTDIYGEDTFATTKTLSINDMLSGGLASLAVDPIKSLQIIDKAIGDVSGLRAQIGAFQANMLQTNANSLNVAIENITKTESYIRDADMAVESTQFSKNQIMVQAGTSMLAQANQLSQGVLSLLG